MARTQLRDRIGKGAIGDGESGQAAHQRKFGVCVLQDARHDEGSCRPQKSLRSSATAGHDHRRLLFEMQFRKREDGRVSPRFPRLRCRCSSQRGRRQGPHGKVSEHRKPESKRTLEADQRRGSTAGDYRTELERVISSRCRSVSGPLKKSMTFMTRGLHYWLIDGRTHPGRSRLHGRRHTGLSHVRHDVRAHEADWCHRQQRKIGDNKVFSCFMQTYLDGEICQATRWGFLFYQRTYIGCITVASNLKQRMPPKLIKDF